MNAVFEGSYLGDGSKLDDDTALECGICWYVYDPAVGDEVAQIAPGTAFAALPGDWRCPSCDAPKEKFMVLGAAEGGAASDDPVKRLVAAYRRVAPSMHGLPIYNPQLIVEAVGFRAHAGRLVGVVVTPWFMNITVLPGEAERAEWRAGSELRLAFPAGAFEFNLSELEGFGVLAACSLFSPMNDFTDHEAARLAAAAAANGLFEADPQAQSVAAPVPAMPRADAAPVTRRALLGVRS